jgi:hypothetical protein
LLLFELSASVSSDLPSLHTLRQLLFLNLANREKSGNYCPIAAGLLNGSRFSARRESDSQPKKGK